MLDRWREERHVAGPEPHPLAAYIGLALALHGEHRLLGHAVAVHLGPPTGLKSEHMQALGLKTVAGPCNQPSGDTVDRDLDAVIE